MVQGHTREIGGSKGGWSSRLGSRGAKAGRIVCFGDLTSENAGMPEIESLQRLCHK